MSIHFIFCPIIDSQDSQGHFLDSLLDKFAQYSYVQAKCLIVVPENIPHRYRQTYHLLLKTLRALQFAVQPDTCLYLTEFQNECIT